MNIRSRLNITNLVTLDTRKFPLMSRGFESRSLKMKVSDSKDFTDVFQANTCDGDAAVCAPAVSS